MLDIIFQKSDGSYTTNFILAADSYKVGQEAHYPKANKRMHSNMVPRKAFNGIEEVVVCGPQLVSGILDKVRITTEMIDEAEIEITEQGYDFPRKNWELIRDNFKGKMPLVIRSLDEGSLAPIGVPIMTIENLTDETDWAVSYIETWAQDICWVGTTVASKLRVLRKKMEQFCIDTGVPVENAEYMIHNFGDRGAGGQDRAILVAMAHGLFFSGTDCLRANRYIKRFFGTDKAYLSSVDATEHSTMCANSDLDTKNDFGAFQMTLGMLARAVDRANRGIGIPLISAVIDTYDDERYVKEFVVGNYEEICSIGGKYVCRPDTGNAVEKPIEVVGWLLDGVYVNKDIPIPVTETGHYKLPENLGVLQGDGLREPDFDAIIELAKANNLAASCFAFGYGGGLTNGSGRDDFSFSMKATARSEDTINWIDMQKMPKSDLGKTSLRGRVSTMKDASGRLFAGPVELGVVDDSVTDMMRTTYTPLVWKYVSYDSARLMARA
jgi:nicotinamide phosphoribosyltransferase